MHYANLYSTVKCVWMHYLAKKKVMPTMMPLLKQMISEKISIILAVHLTRDKLQRNRSMSRKRRPSHLIWRTLAPFSLHLSNSAYTRQTRQGSISYHLKEEGEIPSKSQK